MNRQRLTELLEHVRNGTIAPEEAIERIRALPFQDLGHSKVDLHREVRTGAPEVVFGQNKTPQQLLEIVAALDQAGQDVLVTRLSNEAAVILQEQYPQAFYHPQARVFRLRSLDAVEGAGLVGIVCAGTSDIPVAEEAALTAESLGARVQRIFDVGVAGIHRLLAHTADLQKANALVVVAGMEGALPSVVAGLVDIPVIAVPTSVGYGAHLGGLAPLLAMLNSCGSGVSVVNIDNGFGAGYTAALINRQVCLAAIQRPTPSGSGNDRKPSSTSSQ